MIASRSEHVPPATVSSAVVLTLIVAANAWPGSASANSAATVATTRPPTGRRVRDGIRRQPPARPLAVSRTAQRRLRPPPAPPPHPPPPARDCSSPTGSPPPPGPPPSSSCCLAI